MKRFICLIFCIIIAASLAGCVKKSGPEASYSIKEAEEIQKSLDAMSYAILNKDWNKLSTVISSSCPQKNSRLKRFRDMTAKQSYSKYSYEIKKASQAFGGIVCNIEINSEVHADDKVFAHISAANYFFIKEDADWKLLDFNYRPFANPSIVVGSDSIVYDSASELANTLSSRLYTDKNHLQAYGDIIMVGTPYDNASILDLELRSLTTVRVTDNYPGEQKGVVQVLPGIDDYRYVILIQGSSSSSTIMAADFMGQYIKENQFMLPGVYIIENNSIRPADPLEMSVLQNFDREKADERLFEVQKNIEANIVLILDETANEKDQLLKTQKNTDNLYLDDFAKAFDYGRNLEPQHMKTMISISAGFADKTLCKAAFELPQGGSLGSTYAFSDYIAKNELDSSPADSSTAILRLSGFSESQVFNSTTKDNEINFINIDNGYLIDSSGIEKAVVMHEFPAEEIMSIENDSSYVDYEAFASNMPKEDISGFANTLNAIYDSKKDLTVSRIERTDFKETDNIKSQPLMYNTSFVYDMLKGNTLSDNMPLAYSSLSEAKSVLKEVMGEFLSVKCSAFLYNAASKYPGSQYDFARFSAGFVNVEHPNVYALGADKSKLSEKTAYDIKVRKFDYDSRLKEIVNLLAAIDNNDAADIGSISNKTEAENRFAPPDFCLSSKKGSAHDKALLAFGLYLNTFGSDEHAFVVLGEGSSYLAFNRNDQWRFLDCKDNTVKDYIDDDINIAFNLEYIYNEEMEIGVEPVF